MNSLTTRLMAWVLLLLVSTAYKLHGLILRVTSHGLKWGNICSILLLGRTGQQRDNLLLRLGYDWVATDTIRVNLDMLLLLVVGGTDQGRVGRLLLGDTDHRF